MRGIIYKYTCRINNKVYIGQTVNETSRKSAHKRMASEWRSYFYNAISKYGYESFDYEVIYEVISDIPGYVKQILDIMEIYYIQKYKSTNPEFGYNIALGGGGTVGVPCSEEHRQKISQILKDKHIVANENQINAAKRNVLIASQYLHNEKAVLKYSLDGVLLESFNSYKEAAASMGTNERAFGNAMRKKINKGYYKGFYWKLEADNSPMEEYINPSVLRFKPKYKIKQFTKDGTLLHVWNSFSEIARALNVTPATIQMSLRDRPNRYRGYKWEIIKLKNPC